MPELPEVEVCRRNLARWSRGRTIAEVLVPDPSSVRATTTSRPSAASGAALARLRTLVGRPCGPLLRHGKRILWRLGDVGLVLHLGMTGRFVRRPRGETPRWGRVGLALDDDRVLWLVDPRRFGAIAALPIEAAETALHEGLGPDALDAAPEGPGLAAALGRRGRIKIALMDQARLAGLGNIQAVEVLFRVGVHPETPCAALDGDDWARIAAAVPEQLRASIADFQADEVVYLSDGGAGESPFQVYGRAGLPCLRCGAPIASAMLGGRTTTWCPSCQPRRST